jgi:hypothetical protein
VIFRRGGLDIIFGDRNGRQFLLFHLPEVGRPFFRRQGEILLVGNCGWKADFARSQSTAIGFSPLFYLPLKVVIESSCWIRILNQNRVQQAER